MNCIRKGGFSSTTVCFNPCGWPEHAAINRPSARRRSRRHDGALKNKAHCRDSARAHKKEALVLDNYGGLDWEQSDVRVAQKHVRVESQHVETLQQLHNWQNIEIQNIEIQKCQFSQLSGSSFEEKLINGMAIDVSQLCLTEFLKNYSCASPECIELHVPLCTDFGIKQLGHIEVQLVSSLAAAGAIATARPWFSSRTRLFEQALSRMLERAVANALRVRCTLVSVTSIASLGCVRCTGRDQFSGCPRLYLWCTALAPHVSVWICTVPQHAHDLQVMRLRRFFTAWRRRAQVQLEDEKQRAAAAAEEQSAEAFLCVHRHFAWWQYAAECSTKQRHNVAGAAAAKADLGRCARRVQTSQRMRVDIAWGA
jgi:hypothetical protein